ncbi:MAG TPA: STAS domain-containing protein [Candidatus Cybelea sp.]
MIDEDGLLNSAAILVVFQGEYDLASKNYLQREFALLADAPSVVLDFSEVTYFDSTVIAELVALRQTRAAAGLEQETIVLRNPNLLRVLEILGLGKLLRVVSSLDDVIGRDGTPVHVRYAQVKD